MRIDWVTVLVTLLLVAILMRVWPAYAGKTPARRRGA